MKLIDPETASGEDLAEFGAQIGVIPIRDVATWESDSSYRQRIMDELSMRGARSMPFGEMTLRDYFAAKALASILESQFGIDTPTRIAMDAYAVADAMLQERAK